MSAALAGMVGPISVTLHAAAESQSVLLSNLRGPEAEVLSAAPDLEVRLRDVERLPHFEAEYSAGKLLQFNRQGFQLKGPGFIAQVTGLFNAGCRCTVNVGMLPTDSIRSLLQSAAASIRERRLVTRTTQEKSLQSVMSYSLFWFLVHAVLMKKGAGFIHASSLERNGKGLLFAGAGGCGKTSTTFKLLEDECYRYMAEDFSILGNDGSLHYSPKAMSIYASDLRGSPTLLEEYTHAHMSGAQRSFWQRNKNGPHNPMRKISPLDVLAAQRICKKAPLEIAIFLSRGKFKDIEIREIDSNEFSERSMNASYREMKTLGEILALANAVGGDELGLPDIEAFRDRMRSHFRRSTLACQCYILELPEHSQPQQIAEYISKQIG